MSVGPSWRLAVEVFYSHTVNYEHTHMHLYAQMVVSIFTKKNVWQFTQLFIQAAMK